MQIFAMTDIHGCLEAFKEALSQISLRGDNKLVLLGDYIHGGGQDHEVLDLIMDLQEKHGEDKVIALLGNHEEDVLSECGRPISHPKNSKGKRSDEVYKNWMRSLPLYYVEGKVIFVHAGIAEEAGEYWELGTPEHYFTSKYPPSFEEFDCDKKIVAGHTSVAYITGEPDYTDIYYDGHSHFYIDGDVCATGKFNILVYDTKTDSFCQL